MCRWKRLLRRAHRLYMVCQTTLGVLILLVVVVMEDTNQLITYIKVFINCYHADDANFMCLFLSFYGFYFFVVLWFH